MFGFVKKVGQAIKSAVVSGAKKIAAFIVGVGVAVCGSDAAAATDIVSYSTETGITWDFSSVLTMIFGALAAAIGAGVLVWVAIKGYGLMKRFLSGR